MAISWNANLYDQQHSFVSHYGNNLIELLDPKPREKILDLGCGTGDLAKKLLEYKTEVTGIDKSENMIRQARNKYPDIHFTVGDVTQLPYNNEFDAVFSNAVLHWIQSPKKALQSIYDSLQHGGRFVAEFGGKGNVQILTSEILHQCKSLGMGQHIEQLPWYFPSIAEYTTLMEETGFHVTFAQHFDRPTLLTGDQGLRNWVKMFGDVLFAEELEEEKKEFVVTAVENRLKAVLYKNGNWIADYKRIRVMGIKQ